MRHTGYLFINLAADVLREEQKPLTPGEVWRVALAKGYTQKLLTIGKTPINTLSACMNRHTEGRTVMFKAVSKNPTRFALVEKELK